MRVFFYHTENSRYIYSEWQKGNFPGHLLYGATRLSEYDVDVEMYQHSAKGKRSRLYLNINTAWQLLTCHKHIDAIYATHYTGIELIIFLRVLHFYRRPVIVWQHQPIVKSQNRFREVISRLFYRGIDRLIFFSNAMLEESAATNKFPQKQMHAIPWGADLDFYNRVMRDNHNENRLGFISTGKERRDFKTLIEAFNATNTTLNIYLTRSNLGVNYESLLRDMPPNDNITVHFTEGLIPQKLSVLVNKATCVVICCEPSNYTVGLTTVVEALALGIPIICTRNTRMPMDIEAERCGITVPAHDVDSWIAAIDYIASHPDETAEMGQHGRALAERTFNDKLCAKAVSEVIKTSLSK